MSGNFDSLTAALRRFWFDVRHPFTPNPYDEKKRDGWIDVTHGYSNSWVELIRDIGPHWAGRGIAWTSPIWISVIVYLIWERL